MKTLTLPTPTTPQEALFQARVIERAVNLFSEGYDYTTAKIEFPEFGDPNIFLVFNNEKGVAYIVNMNVPKCECECFQHKNYCKHVLGVEHMLLQCEAMERYYED